MAKVRWRIAAAAAALLGSVVIMAPVPAHADPATVTGTVTDGSNPVAGAFVAAIIPPSTSAVAYGATNQSGQYSLDLQTGVTYSVIVLSPQGTNLVNSVTPNVIAPSAVNVALATGSIVSGTLRDADGPLGAGEACAAAFDVASAGQTRGDERIACTDANGAFAIPGLNPAITYKIQFYGASSDYVPQWLGDVPYGSSAPLQPTTNQTGVNGLLTPGIHISGLVTRDVGGTPVTYAAPTQPPVCIQLLPATGPTVTIRSTCVMPDGTYRMGNLAPGNYRLAFQVVGAASGLRSEYWNDATSVDTAQVLVASTSQTVNVGLAPGTTISGTVRNGSNQPVAGMCISAFLPADLGAGYQWAGATCSAGDGSYTIAGLAPGSYKLQATPLPGVEYQSEWYQDTTSFDTATPVVATAAVAGINFVVAAGRSISGTISGTGMAASSVCVTAFKDMAPGLGRGDFVGGICVRADGTYSLGGLAPGRYRLEIRPQPGVALQAKWYPSAPDYDRAGVVDVTTASQTGIDASLVAGVSISGRVTVAGQPAGAVCVTALKPTGPGWGEWAGGACTTASGTYTLSGLAPGQYKLQFSPYRGNVRSEWWQDAADVEHATLLDVTTDRTGIDVEMSPGVSISGRVTGPGGTPLANVCVSAFEDVGGGYGYGPWAGGTCSNTAGDYTLAGLGGGTYRLEFRPQGSVAARSEWYDDAPDYLRATPVVATTSRTGIDAQLANGVSIAGRVTGAGGVGLANVCVNAFTAATPGHGPWAGGTCSNASGDYAIPGLAPGTYELEFRPQPGVAYKTAWYTSDVVATTSATVGNFSLTAGVSISGTVKDAGAVGIPYVCVTAFPASGPDPWANAVGTCTNSLGEYTISGLGAGQYKLQANPMAGAYRTQWSGGAADYASATVVDTTSPTYDFVLGAGTTISGRVTADGGGAVLGACVFAIDDATGAFGGGGCTNAVGDYAIRGLASGTFRLVANPPPSSSLRPQWWTGVVSTTGGNQTGKDFALVNGSVISGTVRLNSAPISGVCVVAYVVGVRSNSAATACSADDGSFTLRGLSPGAYELLALDPIGGRAFPADAWYGGLATPTDVTAGSTNLSLNL